MSDMQKGPNLEDQEKLSILTKQQRAAYFLRQQKMSYAKIARELKISASAARQLIYGAERRFREYDRYIEADRRNTVPVDFPVTRGELLLMLSGLRFLEEEVEKGFHKVTSYDWKARLPHRYERIKSLNKRIQIAVYGEVIEAYAEDYENEPSN